METLNFTNYISASDYLLEKMSSIEENLDVEHIVIVPEVYTLEFEKLIYGRGKGSFSVQVKSFNRLFSAYCEGGDVISKAGAVLLIKKIVYDISSSLTCFKNSYSKSGFALKMYETISRLRDQGVDPDTMQAESLKKNKINDVKLIYKEYLKRTEGKYVDTTGKKEKLAEFFRALNEKQNKYYYVLNFDVLTAPTMALLNVIDEKSNGVTILNAVKCNTVSKAKNLFSYKAKDGIDQLKAVARCISRDLYNGMSADRIIVAGENLNYDTIKRVLSDFDVPFYMSKKESLGAHPLSIFLLSALSCEKKGIKREDVILLSKNPSIKAEKVERDAFCCYVNENLVDYKGFFEVFERDSKYKIKAEIMRKKVADALSCVGGLRSSISVLDFVAKCKCLLEKASPFDSFGSVDFDKCKELILSSLDFIYKVYENAIFSSDFLIDALRDLLNSTEFSLVQKTMGVVRIGTLNDFRGQRFDKIYLLSFNEGVLPKTEEDVALLSDSDIAEMELCGLKFGDRLSTLNERYRDELWQLLQNECDVFTSYVCEENGKKSYDLQLLEKQFNAKNSSEKAYIDALNNSVDPNQFASLIANRENGKELVSAISNNKLNVSLIKATGGIKEDNYEFIKADCDLGYEPSHTSVSAIQTYYSCPFMYFCRYVLKLEKADDGRVTPLDVGNIMHETISEFLMLEEKEPVQEKVLEIVTKHLDENPKSKLEANLSVVERLKTEAVKVCAIAYEQIRKGSYEVKYCEEGFGKEDNKFSTIEFDYKDGKIPLTGAIDRIDEWKGRARVIDYKTGSGGTFSYSDLYYATKLQLPIYMAVAMKNGYKPGGFFYFPFASSWGEDMSASKLNGVFEESDENIVAMELGALSSGGEVIDLPIDKRNGMPNKKNGLSEEKIEQVCSYALRMAQNALTLIGKGCFILSPIKRGQSSACSYCEFAGVCKKDVQLEERSDNVTDTYAKKYLTKGGEENE